MRMEVEDVFWVTGRGLVATGKTKTIPPTGQIMEIIRPGRETLERLCVGVEYCNCMCNTCMKSIGMLFRNINKGDIVAGDTIVF